ncbi:hypothetical protein MPER_11504 [Moniliophthora perniciosa FA553]|nr:hypothetical protein MPER_11504 [Moniliophthora perniciosa FA553]
MGKYSVDLLTHLLKVHRMEVQIQIPLPWTSKSIKGFSENEDIWNTSIVVQEHSSADIPKRQAVVAAFRWELLACSTRLSKLIFDAAACLECLRDAMGYDEYHPIRRKGTNF